MGERLDVISAAVAVAMAALAGLGWMLRDGIDRAFAAGRAAAELEQRVANAEAAANIIKAVQNENIDLDDPVSIDCILRSFSSGAAGGSADECGDLSGVAPERGGAR